MDVATVGLLVSGLRDSFFSSRSVRDYDRTPLDLESLYGSIGC